jgi:hypothetical protein
MSDTIRTILQRDLARPIEEVIKLDQLDVDTVRGELTDYVATPVIIGAYERIFRAMAEAPSDPPEGIGVWVSGFFGSGKSSFAKNLGYALENAKLGEHYAGELLLKQLGDRQCRDLLTLIHAKMPTVVVMFDVNLDRSDAGVARSISISHYLYRNLLRTLGYSQVLDVAELEFALESQGQLKGFIEHFEKRLKDDWERDPARYAVALEEQMWRWDVRRDLSDGLPLASTRLFELFPQHYPTPDHLLLSLDGRSVEVTPKLLVDRSFAMMAVRAPGKALVFVVDEVGGYVARSADRIEDLRVVVEHFGKVGKNLVKARKAVAPTWVVVTAQEKLDAVVDFLDSKRVELARLQDRFPQGLRVDLAPSDIEEVVSRRVLAKTPAGEAALRALFERSGPEINERIRLERSHLPTALDATRFARFYPYPPHFLQLSIEVVNNLRLQDRGGNNTTAGGSNRTLIRQAYAMLTSAPRGGAPMQSLPVGQLVTFDRVFDLVWSNLSSEQQREILDIETRFGPSSWAARVAKVLCLVQQLRDLPRTEVNLAALLWDGPGAASPLDAVRAALLELRDANFVRLADDGWTLQNQTEKEWTTRKRSIDPGEGEVKERLRALVRRLFDEEPGLARYTYRSLRTLKLGVAMDDHELLPGQLPLHLVTARREGAMAGNDGVVARTWTRSNERASQDAAWWVWARDERVDELLVQLCQSEKIVRQEETRMHGRGGDASELRQLIDQERAEGGRLEGLLMRAVKDALARGVGVFRGVQRAAVELGNDLPAALGAFLAEVVPALYPHLELGARSLKGTEAEEVLKSASLAGLSEVFYGPPKGLELVVQKDQRWVSNPDAPVAKLILGFLREHHGYGEKVTGKTLEAEFTTGVGYAWEVELVQLVLATLLRGGSIEVVHQGARFQSNLAGDPRARAPFTAKPAFRAASFAPRTTPGTKMLVKAATQYEALAGDEVDIEEGAIAEAFKKLARGERERVAPALAVARALALPIAAELQEQQEWWRNVEQGASDDTVKLLAEEGAALADRRQRLARAVDALSADRVAVLRRARNAAEHAGPQVLARAENVEVAGVLERLRAALAGDEWIDEPQRVLDLSAQIERAHEALAQSLARDLAARREEAERAVKSSPSWAELPEARQHAALGMLTEAAQPVEGASLDALEGRLREVASRRVALQQEIARASQPTRQTVRVRALPEGAVLLQGPEDVEEFVARLRARLLKAAGDEAGAAVLVE